MTSTQRESPTQYPILPSSRGSRDSVGRNQSPSYPIEHWLYEEDIPSTQRESPTDSLRHQMHFPLVTAVAYLAGLTTATHVQEAR
jgi:hypothetical protein